MSDWKLLDQVTGAAPERADSNEDSWGVVGPLAWVIDGATSLDGGADERPTPARKFSVEASKQLERLAPYIQSDADLPGLWMQAGSAGAEKAPGAHVAAGSLLRTPEGFSYSVIADVFIVVDLEEPLVITDPRMEPVNREADAAVGDALKRGCSVDDALQSIVPLLRSQRETRMNTGREDGYWVLNGDPAAVGETLYGKVAMANGTRVLACSDGFARLVTESRAYSWRRLLDEVLERGLDSLLSELRKMEEDDQLVEEFLRLSRHDDATAILLC